MDAVVNLASMPEAECAADPRGALLANAGATLALSAAAVSAGASRFIQLSTFKVYGNNPSGIVTEDTITRPVSHYAITHRASEDYAARHPEAVVLRLANGFGAPEDPATPCWGLIVNDFCRQAVTTRRIAIRSDGRAWRNFIPVGDVVAALRAAVTSLPAGTYNLGGLSSMTLREMAGRVAAVCEGTMGFRPEVTVAQTLAGVPPGRLDYRTERLREAGVPLSCSVDDEIARTLLAAARTVAGGARV
jgi:UDP-glucose 4-epimerase